MFVSKITVPCVWPTLGKLITIPSILLYLGGIIWRKSQFASTISLTWSKRKKDITTPLMINLYYKLFSLFSFFPPSITWFSCVLQCCLHKFGLLGFGDTNQPYSIHFSNPRKWDIHRPPSWPIITILKYIMCLYMLKQSNRELIQTNCQGRRGSGKDLYLYASDSIHWWSHSLSSMPNWQIPYRWAPPDFWSGDASTNQC